MIKRRYLGEKKSHTCNDCNSSSSSSSSNETSSHVALSSQSSQFNGDERLDENAVSMSMLKLDRLLLFNILLLLFFPGIIIFEFEKKIKFNKKKFWNFIFQWFQSSVTRKLFDRKIDYLNLVFWWKWNGKKKKKISQIFSFQEQEFINFQKKRRWWWWWFWWQIKIYVWMKWWSSCTHTHRGPLETLIFFLYSIDNQN